VTIGSRFQGGFIGVGFGLAKRDKRPSVSSGFPFILLGILRMKRKKKKEKKRKEGGLVSSWRPLNSLPQAFAKKFSRAEIADSKAQHGIFCVHIEIHSF